MPDQYQSMNSQFSSSESKHKHWLLVALAIVLVLVVLVGIIFLVKKDRNGGEMVDTENDAQSGESMVEELPPLVDAFPDDADRDGISDTREAELGTSNRKIDSDDDGVSDVLEIDVWGTDPTNRDTDGDGYTDGVEITSGFNPNGEGRL